MNSLLGESRSTKDDDHPARAPQRRRSNEQKLKRDAEPGPAYCFNLLCCLLRFPCLHLRSGKASAKMADDDRQPGQSDKPALTNGVHTDGITNGVAPDEDSLSRLDQIRERVASAASQMSSLFNAIKAPLPVQTGDGSQLPQKESPSLSNTIKTVLRDINGLGFERVQDLAETVKKSKLGQPLDDRKYYMVSGCASVALQDALDTT